MTCYLGKWCRFLGFVFCILRGGFYIGDEGLGCPSVADVDLADGSLGIDEDGSQVVVPGVDELLGAGEDEAELFGDGVYVGDFAGEEAPFFGVCGECLSVVFEDFWGVEGGIEGNGKEVEVVGGLGVVLEGFASCFEVLGHSGAEFGEGTAGEDEGEDEEVSFEVAQLYRLVFLIDKGIVWQGVSDLQRLDFAGWAEGGNGVRLRGVWDCLDLVNPAFRFGDVDGKGNGVSDLDIGEFCLVFDGKGHCHGGHVVWDWLVGNADLVSGLVDFFDDAAGLEGAGWDGGFCFGFWFFGMGATGGCKEGAEGEDIC